MVYWLVTGEFTMLWLIIAAIGVSVVMGILIIWISSIGLGGRLSDTWDSLEDAHPFGTATPSAPKPEPQPEPEPEPKVDEEYAEDIVDNMMESQDAND